MKKEVRGHIVSWCIDHLGFKEYNRGWYQGECPFCHGSIKMGLHPSRNQAHCFKCGYNSNLTDFFLSVSNSSFNEAMEILKDQEPIYYTPDATLTSYKPLVEKKVYCSMPPGFHLLNEGDNQISKSARNYIKRRGFNPQTMSSRGWGYCDSSNSKYFGYIIIPFFENFRLVYYNARLYMGYGPKYNNPDVLDTGLGKSFIIYNKDALYMYKTVYLCEGAINAQTMGEKGIASGGKAISRYQVNEIIKSPVERVIILFDPDAKDRAIDLAFKLINYKKVKVIFLPEGKDVNDIGKKKTMKFIYSQRYLDYQELLELKFKYKI